MSALSYYPDVACSVLSYYPDGCSVMSYYPDVGCHLQHALVCIAGDPRG